MPTEADNQAFTDKGLEQLARAMSMGATTEKFTSTHNWESTLHTHSRNTLFLGGHLMRNSIWPEASLRTNACELIYSRLFIPSPSPGRAWTDEFLLNTRPENAAKSIHIPQLQASQHLEPALAALSSYDQVGC